MKILTYTGAVALGVGVALLQRFGVEPSGAPLDDDGIVGRRTLGGLFLDPASLTHPLTLQMARLAKLNAREEGANNQGRWPGYFMGEKRLAALTPEEVAELDAAAVAGWSKITQGPFCAGTVSVAIRLAYGARQPASGSARGLTDRWARRPGRSLPLDELELAQEGDLICWRREAADGNKAAGHIGVVVGIHAGLLLVLEGNGARRNGAVGLYGYDLSAGAARGRGKDQEVIMLARRAA